MRECYTINGYVPVKKYHSQQGYKGCAFTLYSNKSRHCVVVVGLKVLKKSARFNCRFFTIFHFRVSKIDSGYIKDYLIIEKKTIPQKKKFGTRFSSKNSAKDMSSSSFQNYFLISLFQSP